jgi:hypothetical protein
MRSRIGLKSLGVVLTVGSIAIGSIAVATAGANAAPHVAAAASHLAATKHETIVLNSGITPVKLGETKRAVVAALGKPHGTTCLASAPVTCLDYASHGGKQNFDVGIVKGHVFYIRSTRTTDRTKSGIGFGVAWKKLSKAYPKCTLTASYCFLKEPATWLPKNGQLFTYVSSFEPKDTAASKIVYNVVVGKYSTKYEGCALGCG